MVTIYSLPQMRCDPDCGECCGIVACSPHDYRKLATYAKTKGIKPVRQGSTCPWFQKGTCAVYPARPFACRMFGHCERMKCPRGYNVDVTVDDEMRLCANEGQEARKRDGYMMLHESVYSTDEIIEMVAGLMK